MMNVKYEFCPSLIDFDDFSWRHFISHNEIIIIDVFVLCHNF